VAPGDADGARSDGRGTGTTRRAPGSSRPTPAPRAKPAAARASGPARQAAASRKAQHAAPEPIQISRGALKRVTAELDQLTQVKRREVVARIKAAREHGDLKENAEYQAAREEQSFLEGRVQALEDRIRRAVVVDEIATGRVMMGSTVTVEVGGEEIRYTIVGSTESDPTKGRLSTASPVGSALLGAVAGSEVDIRTPRGSVRYRVVAVD
jgi:transcription elongation factor GreA